MELTLKSTPEKYKKMVDELLPPLLELLQKLTFLEEARIFPFGLPCEKGIWQRSYYTMRKLWK